MSNIDAIAAAWLDAKSAELDAQRRRIEIEGELADALGVRDEGSKTHKLQHHKVTITQPVYRSVDADAWEKVKDRIPTDMAPVRWKLEPDATGMKYLASNEPALWSRIAEAFTTKPGKVGVKVEGI